MNWIRIGLSFVCFLVFYPQHSQADFTVQYYFKRVYSIDNGKLWIPPDELCLQNGQASVPCSIFLYFCMVGYPLRHAQHCIVHTSADVTGSLKPTDWYSWSLGDSYQSKWDMAGLENPLTYDFKTNKQQIDNQGIFETTKFALKLYMNETDKRDNLMDFFVLNLQENFVPGEPNQCTGRVVVYPNEMGAPWSQDCFKKGMFKKAEMIFKYRVYCAPFHYGRTCGQFCRENEETEICDKETGIKRCRDGYELDPEGTGCRILCPCVHGFCPAPGVCTCDEGWIGSFCELKDPCRPNPCLNGGVCSVVSNGGNAFQPRCQCADDWTGYDCGTNRPPPPMNIRVMSATKYSITLQWDAVSSAFNYQIFYNEKDSTFQQQTSSTATQRTITGLRPNTWYQFEIAAESNNVQGRRSEAVEGQTLKPIPNPPTNLQASNKKHNSFDVSWIYDRADGPILAFVVEYRRRDGSSRWQTMPEIQQLFQTLEGLDADTLYDVRVKARNQWGWSQWSETLPVQTGTNVPDAPLDLRVDAKTSSSLSLEWFSTDESATSFVLEYRRRFRDVDWTEVAGIREARHVIENLEPDTDYDVRVFSVNGDGMRSPASLPVWDKTEKALALKPLDVRVDDLTSRSATVYWTRPNDPIPLLFWVLQFRRRGTNEDWSQYKIRSQETQFRLDNLRPLTNYEVRIRGENGYGPGENSEEVNFKTEVDLPTPPDLEVSSVAETSATMAWGGGSPNTRQYVLRYRVMGSGPWVEVRLSYANTRYTLDNLKAGNNYEVEILGIGDGGVQGEPSDRKTFVTRIPTPTPPSNIRVEDRSPTAVLIKWDKDPKASWYLVYYRKEGVADWKSETVHDSVISLPGLDASTVYQFRVVGHNDLAKGEPGEVTHRTKDDVPLAPTRLEASEITERSVMLRWDLSAPDVFQYLIEYRPVGSGKDWTSLSSLMNERRVVDLTPSTTYEFRVSAANACCRSPPSTGVRATTATPPPDDPLLEAVDLTTTSATIRWNPDRTGRVSSYTLEYKKKDGSSAGWRSVPGILVNSYQLRDLDPNTDYEVRVIAKSPYGDSNPGATYFTTSQDVPFAPINLQVTSWDTDSVSLSWTPGPVSSSAVLFYTVEYQRLNDVKGVVVAPGDIRSTSKTVEALVPDTNYQFHVIAVNANGRSTPSQWVTAKTDRFYPCIPNPCRNNGTCNPQGNKFFCNCKDLYSGPNCGEFVPFCTKYPNWCYNGGNCTDAGNSGRCSCPAGFQGVRCEDETPVCDRNPCQNRGTCKSVGPGLYMCECWPGYTGTNCEIDVKECASNPCKNGGTCREPQLNTFKCDCVTGYTGTTCEHEVNPCLTLRPCLNGGTCYRDISKMEGYRCVCLPGFTGKQCELDKDECAPNPCLNGGKCTESFEGGYRCTCPYPYTGKNCQTMHNICLSKCVNGKCIIEGTDYKCICDPGYTGRHCGVDIDDCDPSPCGPNGFCTDLINAYKCTCLQGYSGADCSVRDKFCDPNPCLNGASCEETPLYLAPGFICVCPAGYTGKRCDQTHPFCRECRNGAVCQLTPTPTCVCRSGFEGQFCEKEIRQCEPNPCQNGGVCRTDSSNDKGFRCDCLSFWRGTLCTEWRPCPDVCKNGANCVTLDSWNGYGYKCECPANWSGPNCTDGFRPCDANPCVNGGTCVDAEEETLGYKCLCPKGYDGDRCERVTEVCIPNPCLHGVCYRWAAGEAKCLCNLGWIGKFCEEDENECQPNPCKNGARCEELPAAYGGGFRCICPAKYQGTICDEDKTLCTLRSCLNGGSCYEKENRIDVRCACRKGFTGKRCEIDINECMPNPCQNQAQCQESTPGNYICICPDGLGGWNCDKVMSRCYENKCANGATCRDVASRPTYTCVCPPGWTGALCDIIIDVCLSADCGHGICVATGTSYRCECENGWCGPRCSTVGPCGECLNGGTPYSNLTGRRVCDCPIGFTGASCETKVDFCYRNKCNREYNATLRCENRTELNTYKCICAPGWKGRFCEEDIKECWQNPSPCKHGTCTNLIGSYECTCDLNLIRKPGWIGKNCDINVNECLNSPCEQGLCVDVLGNFRCQCYDGAEGELCNRVTGQFLDCGCGESVWHLAAIIIGYLVGLLLMFLMAAMVWYGISLEPRRAPSAGDSALFYEDEYARAAAGAYAQDEFYGGYQGIGTMSTMYGDHTLQRRRVDNAYSSEFYPAGGNQLPYSVPGSGTLGRRTICSASTMGNGATLPKVVVTPAGNLRQRGNSVAVATSTLPKSGSAVATATVSADVAHLENDDAHKAIADWVIHSSTQRLAEDNDNNDSNNEDVGMLNLGEEPPPMMGVSSSYSKTFTMEQTIDGDRGRGQKSNVYRIKTPEDGSVKITTPDGAVKLNADGRNTLGKPHGNDGAEAMAMMRNGEMPSMVGNGDNMRFSSQQTTSFSYEYMMDKQ